MHLKNWWFQLSMFRLYCIIWSVAVCGDCMLLWLRRTAVVLISGSFIALSSVLTLSRYLPLWIRSWSLLAVCYHYLTLERVGIFGNHQQNKNLIIQVKGYTVFLFFYRSNITTVRTTTARKRLRWLLILLIFYVLVQTWSEWECVLHCYWKSGEIILIFCILFT